MAKRVIWIVLDSAGIGEEPDADKFGDVGSDTFGHILETYPDAKFDNLTKLGLRAIENTSFFTMQQQSRMRSACMERHRSYPTARIRQPDTGR